ncbi:hypothetical protein OG320_15170 [Microbispora sp. NBC_01189]|uniref:hypothetical protein n=1 Tax=Microbispora sp. NBC_01189 TaxID=2903583 RepID=UPI002E0FA2F2|nr:hypothetical protein OG320_15170 [Microbispora sp. NBC_01189]
MAGAAKQLNLTSRGRLATTRLGQAVIREALSSITVAGAASFLGALLPVAVGVVLPGPSWVPLAISVAILGAPGAGIGAAVGGAPARWSCALAIGGACVAAVGLPLDIA